MPVLIHFFLPRLVLLGSKNFLLRRFMIVLLVGKGRGRGLSERLAAWNNFSFSRGGTIIKSGLVSGIGVRRGVSKREVDGRRPPALREDHPRNGRFGSGPPSGRRRAERARVKLKGVHGYPFPYAHGLWFWVDATSLCHTSPKSVHFETKSDY
jgi:hypothetical protein